nr:diaminopimelate decarboxylase [Sporolactobacillus vineae]
MGTQTVSDEGHLMIGGVDTVDLAREFGTPLYIYDRASMRSKIKEFQSAFARYKDLDWQIAYASKAFSTIAMIQLANEYGLSLDVVSGGELYTALKAGFPAEKIHFHGNNKSDAELKLALESGVGLIIVDNFYELERLEAFCTISGKQMAVLLRVTPGVEAHTHEFIMTGHDDTKFGFNLDNGMADRAVHQTLQSPHLDLRGVHCHIGSQIFETEGFNQAVRLVLNAAATWKRDENFELQVLNVGGGFGIRYTREDHPLPVHRYIDQIVSTVREVCAAGSLHLPSIWIEPGRSIVGEAGTSLYTLGSTKNIPGIRDYISVDGGMADNIRPALYQAKYEALCANRAGDPAGHPVTIAGKCCETGDVLIQEALLPESCGSGDLLAVFSTGAYGYSMASHYNRLPNPAVVFVENGSAELVVRRETYEDLIRNDLPLKALSGRS